MDTITRVCRKCGQEKPLSEFAKDKNCALGHTHICKQCKADQSRKRYAVNPEKMREYAREYRAANLEKCREMTRKWRAANPEKSRESTRKRRAANPEKAREYAREYARKWRAANPEKSREIIRKSWCKCVDNLNDNYLRHKLKDNNLPITPETIDYKRIQLKLYREIKNQQNDERD
jgi:hypothetical protein|nr:MAG TPA: restriction endonuclease [Caudoviricetes sp.]